MRALAEGDGPCQPRRIARTSPHIATLVLLTTLKVLTLNMFLPALPAMRAEFEVSEMVMGRSISVCMLAAAALQLLLGPLSDRVDGMVAALP